MLFAFSRQAEGHEGLPCCGGERTMIRAQCDIIRISER